MPDEDDDLTTESEHDSELVRKLRKQLKQANKQATPEVDTAALQREVALLKAGINPDDPKAKYFAKAYDGPLETDAIVREATAAGIIGTTQAAAADDGGDDGREVAMANLDTMRSAAAAQRSQAPATEVFGAEYQAALLGLKDQNLTPEAGTQAVLAMMRKAGIRTTQDI